MDAAANDCPLLGEPPTIPEIPPPLFGGRFAVDDFEVGQWVAFEVVTRKRGEVERKALLGKVEAVKPAPYPPFDDVLFVRVRCGDGYTISPARVIDHADEPSEKWWV